MITITLTAAEAEALQAAIEGTHAYEKQQRPYIVFIRDRLARTRNARARTRVLNKLRDAWECHMMENE